MRLIDADALIETLNKENTPFNADINYFISYAPTIESRPKGRWIRDFDGNEFHTYCSNCNEEFYEEDLVTVGDEKLPNYCPLCGADMREEAIKETKGEQHD